MEFQILTIQRPEDVPPPDTRVVDVAVLDMHHNWPNLGHDALVDVIRQIAADERPFLETSSMGLRVLSYDVRGNLRLPEEPGGRFSIYIGTGGPGHLDPRLNDGLCPESQGVLDDPSWEAPLFRLFDAILEREDAALMAVCHSFGVVCRWAGVARPVLRGPDKNGKSSGIVENVLTTSARSHPFFSKFATQLPDGRHFSVLDSRLFDLFPNSQKYPAGVLPLSHETAFAGGPEGVALTALELARDKNGMVPRVLAVNHHPEIVDHRRQKTLLEKKFNRHEVPPEWYRERQEVLGQIFSSPELAGSIRLTSLFTLLIPLRFHVYRQLRLKAESLGISSGIHEDRALDGHTISSSI